MNFEPSGGSHWALDAGNEDVELENFGNMPVVKPGDTRSLAFKVYLTGMQCIN